MMTVNDLIRKLEAVAECHKNTRVCLRVECEEVFSYYDPEFVEFDSLTNEIYVTTEDKRGIPERFYDLDCDTNTIPLRPATKGIGEARYNYDKERK